MSAQAGVFYFDGRPVDRDLIASIGRSFDELGLGRAGHYTAPGLAMVHRAMDVTPEDALESQPLVSACGTVMTWDGRLDNRADLLFQLGHTIGNDRTDVALASAVYLSLGESGFDRLIGDWSLAIWDPDERSLRLASDYAGNRGLYYWTDGHSVHWSTSQTELVSRLGLADRLEPRFLIGFLTAGTPPLLTPHRDLLFVPPGHCLTWSPHKAMGTHRFWQISAERIRYRDQRDYEVGLRTIFSEAVRVRLRSSQPVWAELSGGLDSSSIVCMADRLRDMGAVSSRPIETASLVSDASPECDERPFISAVEQQRGRPGHYMLMDRLEGSDSKRAELIASLYANRLMTQLRRFASRGGARVLMTGNPGDAVMVNAPTDVGSIVEALDEGRWPRALGHAHEWCRSCRMTVWELTARVGRHYSRRADIRSAMRERLRSANVTTGRRLHENVEEAFHFTAATARLWINDAERGAERAHAHGRRGKRFLVRALVSLIETRDFESPLEYLPVLYTHPYMHRPLVEYMLAIPAEVTCSPGQPRALMRRAFGGLLPPRITARFSKGGTDPLTIRTLRARLEALGPVDRMLTVQSGYIDAARLKATCSGIRSGSCVNLRNTERIVRLELWLRERVQTEDAQRKEVEPCTAVQN